MQTILDVLETWERERAPLALDAGRAEGKYDRLATMGRLINLDARATKTLEGLGFPPGGYSIPSALALVRGADRRALGLLADWRAELEALDGKEMALSTAEERWPVAKTKAALNDRVARELDALGVPVWGIQIESAMRIIGAVCAERDGLN